MLKVLAGLVGIALSLAAMAYAATAPPSGGAVAGPTRSVEPGRVAHGALMPGWTAAKRPAPTLLRPLPLELTQSNPVAILVTGLSVSVTADPEGCDSAQNLELTQSNVSGQVPLGIPAGGSARVPSQGIQAPTIELRNLSVNQDACQNARFPLAFTGTAR